MNKLSNLAVVFLIVPLFLFLRTSPVHADDWPQDAHDAQRTGYTQEDPGNGSRWSFAWFWESPAHNNPPREGRSVTGDGKIYLPAGSSGLYALNLSTGAQVWRYSGTFNSTPAYSSGYIYAGSQNGTFYKISSSNGSLSATFNAGSPINKSVLVANGYAYIATEAGSLFKINLSNMTSVWQYSAGARIDTPPAYSSQGILVFGTADLYIHGVSDSAGNRLWRVKPSPNSPGTEKVGGWNTLNWGWPVIAEKHGLVLIRQQLPHQSCLYSYDAIWPTSISAAQTYLTNTPSEKNLFVLDLRTGSEKFVAAVGCGSTEWALSGTTFGLMGTVPAVKVWPNGDEVVYIPFRNGQNSPLDSRWDGHMGEMVLDNTTVPGLTAGQLRFVRMSRYNDSGNSYVHVVDEQAPLTIAGNNLLYAHWGGSEGVVISDRSISRGNSFTNPITTTNLPVVIRRLTSCSNYNSATHYANCGLTLFNDGRYWNGPGWAVYSGVIDPPGLNATSSYSAGILPRYTYVSGGYVIVEGNGGDMLVLAHGGPVTATPTSAPQLSPTPTSSASRPGDANGDGRVTGSDYIIWLNYYGKTASGPSQGDFNNDNRVNGSDYIIWLTNYGT